MVLDGVLFFSAQELFLCLTVFLPLSPPFDIRQTFIHTYNSDSNHHDSNQLLFIMLRKGNCSFVVVLVWNLLWGGVAQLNAHLQKLISLLYSQLSLSLSLFLSLSLSLSLTRIRGWVLFAAGWTTYMYIVKKQTPLYYLGLIIIAVKLWLSAYAFEGGRRAKGNGGRGCMLLGRCDLYSTDRFIGFFGFVFLSL